jgi:biotin transporter BioY
MMHVLAFSLGVFWGLVNLYFIEELTHELIVAKQKKFIKIMVIALIKFPVLYSVGFAWLYYQSDFALASLLGFSGALLMGVYRKYRKEQETLAEP